MPWKKTAYVKRASYAKKAYTPKKKIYKKTSISSAVKSYVKKTIARTEEMKFSPPVAAANQTFYELTAGNVKQWNPFSLAACLTIAQGTGQGDRIGNQITLKSWEIRGYLTPAPAGTATDQQVIVRLYIGQRKDLTAITSAKLTADVLQFGDTVVGYLGTMNDLMLDINKDEYKIFYQKDFKLGCANSAGATANNDYNYTGKFRYNLCTKHFKNYKVKYEDAATAPVQAQINSVYMWCSVMNATGLTTVAAGGPLVAFYDISYYTVAKYTDS